MSAETECPLSELPPSQCACPKHRGQGEADIVFGEFETVGQPFAARYGGLCAACGGRIHEGQMIARAADQPTEYAHAGQGCAS